MFGLVAGWAIGGILGGLGGVAIGLAAPAIIGGVSSAAAISGSGLAIAGGGAIAATTAITITGAQLAEAALGVTILLALIGKSNGYEIHKYSNDHDPDHMHLIGEGNNIRFGKDGKPLPGQKLFNAQQRKVIKKLWGLIKRGFGLN